MVDAKRKREILLLAADSGPTKAAQQSGVSANTIKSWQRRTKTAVAPSEPRQAVVLPTGPDGVEDLLRRARELHGLSEDAARAVKSAIRGKKTTGSKDLALAVGILIDQAAKLEAGAKRMQEDGVRIEAERAQVIQALIEGFMEAMGLPFAVGSPARAVLAAMLRSAGTAEAMSAPEPQAAQARMEIRRVVGLSLDRVALPAPAEPDGDEVEDDGVDGEEIEDAEVVAEPEPVPPRVTRPQVASYEAIPDAATASHYRAWYADEDRARREYWRDAKAGTIRRGDPAGYPSGRYY